MNQLPYLTEVSPVEWSDVASEWKKREENRDWRKHWTERGYASWEEWRGHRWDLLQCPEREWTLHACTDPAKAVPQWHGGPFASWAERYDGKVSESFAELVKHPKVLENDRIRSIANTLPTETYLVGLLWRQRILIFEGMHSCCGMALAASEGRPVTTDVKIAIADIHDVTEERLQAIARTQRKN